MKIGDTVVYKGQPGSKPVLVTVLNIGKLITIRFPSGQTRAVAPFRITPQKDNEA